MGYIFDGPNKLIILDSTANVDVLDMYSKWKEWVAAGNAQYVFAFRSVAGDPISSSQNIAPYIFLNTPAGWRIRPAETNHQLTFLGNLYSDDPNLSLFVPTLGNYTVTIIIERSSAAIAVSTTGGGGLTTEQANQLEQTYKNTNLQTALLLR